MKVKLCPTLSDPMDCSPPGSSIHGIFQARVLEWGAIAFSQPELLPHKHSPPQTWVLALPGPFHLGSRGCPGPRTRHLTPCRCPCLLGRVPTLTHRSCPGLLSSLSSCPAYLLPLGHRFTLVLGGGLLASIQFSGAPFTPPEGGPMCGLSNVTFSGIFRGPLGPPPSGPTALDWAASCSSAVSSSAEGQPWPVTPMGSSDHRPFRQSGVQGTELPCLHRGTRAKARSVALTSAPPGISGIPMIRPHSRDESEALERGQGVCADQPPPRRD